MQMPTVYVNGVITELMIACSNNSYMDPELRIVDTSI